MLRRFVAASGGDVAAVIRGKHDQCTPAAVVTALMYCIHLYSAPPALADPSAGLSVAVTSARSETSCSPLQSNPVVEHAADVYNRMTEDYLEHTGLQVPGGETAPGDHVDPVPGLKTLGYNASGGSLLQGAHRSEPRAIQGALLEGQAWHAIEDCSFTEFGTSLRRNQRTGFYVAAVVLTKL
jgi:hypothetical protein